MLLLNSRGCRKPEALNGEYFCCVVVVNYILVVVSAAATTQYLWLPS